MKRKLAPLALLALAGCMTGPAGHRSIDWSSSIIFIALAVAAAILGGIFMARASS